VRAIALSLLLTICGCTPAAEGLWPLSRSPRYALVFSDYSSSSIGLFDAELLPLAEDWVTSGTRAPILVTPVTGDAVLPSVSLGALAWIDRFPSDVVTIVDPTRPEGLVQLDVHGEGPTTGFVANPHDALRLSDGRILVTRHNPDDALPDERGNDLFAIDPVTSTGTRIALGCDAPPYFARPDQLARVVAGGRAIVVVALARLNRDFSAAGEGALATVDARTLSVLACAPLPGTANCQYVRAMPGEPDRVVVLCTGQPRQPEAVRREEASVLEVRVDAGGAVTIEARLDARALPEGLTPAAYPLPLGGDVVLATADGRGTALDPMPDRLLRLDLAAGTAEVLAETEAFHFGSGVLDEGRALWPDGATNEILVYDVAREAIVERTSVPTQTGLPLRQIGLL
jgi:hypothetical protein